MSQVDSTVQETEQQMLGRCFFEALADNEDFAVICFLFRRLVRRDPNWFYDEMKMQYLKAFPSLLKMIPSEMDADIRERAFYMALMQCDDLDLANEIWKSLYEMEHSFSVEDALARDDFHDFSVLEFLIFHGANPNAQDEDGRTWLNLFAFYLEENYSSWDNVPTASGQFLIENGADPNTKDNGWTPLHHVAMSERHDLMDTAMVAEFARFLVQNGADPNIQDQNGNTLLHFARSKKEKDNLNLVKSLESANPNLMINDGETPLCWLVLEWLVEDAGANPRPHRFQQYPRYLGFSVIFF